MTKAEIAFQLTLKAFELGSISLTKPTTSQATSYEERQACNASNTKLIIEFYNGIFDNIKSE